MERRTWAIVLAAGDGSRLSSLTVDERGAPVPKQFCSLHGGPSLLEEALARASAVASPERTLVVVAEAHRRFWRGPLAHLPRRNVLVQPANRGTAAGLLLPLLDLVERDPQATVVVLPADHHVRREHVLAAALRVAAREAASLAAVPAAVLLGMVPDAPESSYGWIASLPVLGRLRPVQAFVEKPPPELAERLLRSGALWSSFILAARAQALLDLLARFLPELVRSFRAALPGGGDWSPAGLAALYEGLAPADLSRDVLQPAADHLLVLEVPPCGWTDLGTPERVRACLEAPDEPPLSASRFAPLVLARTLSDRAGSLAGLHAG